VLIAPAVPETLKIRLGDTVDCSLIALSVACSERRSVLPRSGDMANDDLALLPALTSR